MFQWREAPSADLCVIGDPVSHSLSPVMHQAALRALGLEHRYIAVHVPAGEVEEALSHLRAEGYVGVNVTVPHKAEALEWLEAVSAEAQAVRAVNTISLQDRRGTNTDIPGFLDTLADLGLSGGRALVLGAGGSARAVVYGLAKTNLKVSVWNRTPARARQLVSDLRVCAEVVETPEMVDADLVVNTTSASLLGERIEVGWEAMPKAVAYDLMYARTLTPFLEDARSHGLKTVDGRHLLVAQGAHSLGFWFGMTAPRDVMLGAIS